MKKLSLLIIIMFPFYNLFSQDSGVTDADRELIEQLLYTTIGDSCGINDIVCVDTVLRVLDPDEGGFENPYNTLTHCFVFTYSRTNPNPNINSEYKQSIGVFKNGQIMALLDTVIETFTSSCGRIKTIADLNNDGDVDIVVTRTLGVSPPPWEGYWIFSWNGASLRLISAIDDVMKESSLKSPWNFLKFVDVDGNGTCELMTEYEDENGVESKVAYTWNGQMYGKWGNAPSPLSSGAYPRNNIDALVRCSVQRNADTLVYSYSLMNSSTSTQSINEFFLESPDTLLVLGTSPVDWVMAGQRGRYFGWIALPGFNKYLQKGKTESNYAYNDNNLPAIINSFVRGYNLSDDFFVNSQFDWEKVYQDVLTNSKIVKTVAPLYQLKNILPSNFLDTLTSYTTQSRTLGWITDQATANKYLNYFSTAKTQLTANKIDSVILTLQTVISSTITDSTSLLTSEAYALLRFNTEYLLNHVKHIPQNLNTAFSSRIITLSWTACTESDMPPNGGGYEVYKALSYEGITPTYVKLNTALLTTASYSDTINLPGDIPAEKNVYLNYYIKAVNNTGSIQAQSAVCSLFVGKTTSGTISSDSTWSQNKIIVGDVTVNSGKTLTISGGKTILSASGKKLIINGILSMNSSSSSLITFDRSSATGTWGGIQYNSGSSGTIQYCNIYRAYTGIYFNGTSLPVVANNTISNCSASGVGLYAASPRIHHNIISANGSYGISCYSSSPKLDNNTITGHTAQGLSCSNYSSPLLGETPYQYYPGHGHNVIKQNVIGISASYYSNPLLGQGPAAGQNCVHNNSSYEMSAGYVSGTIYAENTWWNYPSSPYYIASDFNTYQATIDYIPTVSSDPNGCSAQGSVQEIPPIISGGALNSQISTKPSDESNIKENQVSSSSEGDELQQLRLLELEGKIDQAIAGYVKYYKKETSKETQKYVLARLAECYRSGEKKDFIDFLNKEIRTNLSKQDELYATTLELENIVLIRDGNYNKAIENYDILKSSFSSKTNVVKHALFNLGYIYYKELNNVVKGKEYFDELKTKYPGDELTQQSEALIVKK